MMRNVLIIELMRRNDITEKDILRLIELRKLESLENFDDRKFYDKKIHRLIDFRRDLLNMNMKNAVIEKMFERIEKSRKYNRWLTSSI